MPIVIALAYCGIAAGSAITLWAWRGRRINDHSVCARCGYDLSGLIEPSQCPECGADLKLNRAIRQGQRVRRRFWIAAGVALLAGSATLLISRIHWTSHVPLWYLTWRAETADDAGAFSEIFRRLHRAELSHDQRDGLIVLALTQQADLSKRWNSLWET